MAPDGKNGEKLDMQAPAGDKLRVVSDKKGGSIAAPGGGGWKDSLICTLSTMLTVYYLLTIQMAA